MASKIWSFLLPETGAHELRAEALDTYTPQVFLDEQRLEQVQTKLPMASHGRTLVFAGPSDAPEIELHLQGSGQCQLVVNGTFVEDYAAKRTTGDQSLRQLRGRPDGSYLICPDIDASHLALNIVRKFRFSAGGQVHEVQIAHGDGIWQVISDGHLVDRVAHKFEDTSGEAHFNIQAADGLRLRTMVFMRWIKKASGPPEIQEDRDTAMGNRYGFGDPDGSWRYDLNVNGVRVPVCWTKVRGDLIGAGPPPAVTQEAVEELPEASFLSPTHDRGDQLRLQAPADLQSLPQGVSFDSSHGAYQASLRAKSGKFIFLGEFATPEEAHQRYLEAVPIHCPDKVLVPDQI